MSYLNAVKGNKGSSSHSLPASTQAVVPPPETKNEPAQDPVVEDEVEEQPVNEKAEDNVQETFPSSSQVSRVGNKKNTGLWTRLEFEDEEKENEFWKVFALAAGPGGLCNFALTCTYFFDKLLTQNMWDLVQHLLPPVLIPVIHLKIETSIESGSVEKTQTVPISSLRQNYQINQLLTYWFRLLNKAEDERSKKDDITAPLNAVLNGGFAIETASEKKNIPLCYLQDLKLVISVTNAVKQLIFRTTKSVKIDYRSGGYIKLALYGRGGTNISLNVKAGKESCRAIFPLDLFANQIRKAAKKFVNLAGSCRMQLQRQRNNIAPDNTNSFQEKEQWIVKTLEHDALNKAVEDLRKRLAFGVVPDSQLPEHFQLKEQQKDKKQSQQENENNNIMDLILENLPPHFEEAKKAAKVLEDAAVSQRQTEENDRQARIDAKRQEREREKEEKKKIAEALEKPGVTLEQAQEEVKAQVAKKQKTKVVMQKDAEGFNVKVVVPKGKPTKENAFDKKEVETTPEKVQTKSKKTASTTEQQQQQTDDKNNFYIADFDDVPSPADYQITYKEAKQKGMEKSQQNKKKYPTPAPKPDKDKKKEKKVKQEKAAPVPQPPKKQAPLPVPTTDVPFFQNDLVKPLVYLVAFVSLLSVVYLILS